MAKRLFEFRAQIMMPGAWRQRLEAIAARRSMRVSELLREIIREYLDDEKQVAAEREYLANLSGERS